MERYLGIQTFEPHTFVGSTALFERNICDSMEQKCINWSGMNLINAVDHMLRSGGHPKLPFSEFECYGHHVLTAQRAVTIKPKNWNYVYDKRSDYTQPIQIMWQPDHKDLDMAFDALMQHACPKHTLT